MDHWKRLDGIELCNFKLDPSNCLLTQIDTMYKEDLESYIESESFWFQQDTHYSRVRVCSAYVERGGNEGFDMEAFYFKSAVMFWPKSQDLIIKSLARLGYMMSYFIDGTEWEGSGSYNAACRVILALEDKNLVICDKVCMYVCIYYTRKIHQI